MGSARKGGNPGGKSADENKGRIRKEAAITDQSSEKLQARSSLASPPPYSPEGTSKPIAEKLPAKVETARDAAGAKRSWTARLLWVLVACVTAGIYQLYSKAGLESQSVDETWELSYESICSGHGIELRDRSCVCDIGYRGSRCQDAYDIGESRLARKPTSGKPSVLIVADSTGPLDLSDDEHSSADKWLAEALAADGQDVTLLYVGAAGSGSRKHADHTHTDKAVKIAVLPTSGINYGPSPLTTTSMNLFRWIYDHPSFDVVHFPASRGFGYYTLLAKHQGLLPASSRMVVSVDAAPSRADDGRRRTTDFDEFGPATEDPETLRLEFMREKSAQYADLIVVPTGAVEADIRHLGWIAQGATVRVAPSIASPSPQRRPDYAAGTPAAEFVFIAERLDQQNGLNLMCDAVDRLVAAGAAADVGGALQVTFVGQPDTIAGAPSAEYIEGRSARWTGISWDVRGEPQTTSELISYLSPFVSTRRVAVLAAAHQGSERVLAELASNELPVIASDALYRARESAGTATFFVSGQAGSLAELMARAVGSGHSSPDAADLPNRENVRKTWAAIFHDAASEPVRVPAVVDDEIPLVSVVLVHRNRHNFLKQAIKSLQKQTFNNIEVVLVDDGSDDPDAVQYLQDLSWDWWENRGWKVLREKHRYLGAARNTGAKHAKGSFILFMDDDDYAKPQQVETLVGVAKRTGAEIVTAGYDIFEGHGAPPGGRGAIGRSVPLGGAKDLGRLEECFGASGILVARDFFAESGGFTEDFGVGYEGHEFLARAVLAGRHLEAIPEPLLWHRRHAGALSVTTDRRAGQARLLRAYAAAADADRRHTPRAPAEEAPDEKNVLVRRQAPDTTTTTTDDATATTAVATTTTTTAAQEGTTTAEALTADAGTTATGTTTTTAAVDATTTAAAAAGTTATTAEAAGTTTTAGAAADATTTAGATTAATPYHTTAVASETTIAAAATGPSTTPEEPKTTTHHPHFPSDGPTHAYPPFPSGGPTQHYPPFPSGGPTHHYPPFPSGGPTHHYPPFPTPTGLPTSDHSHIPLEGDGLSADLVPGRCGPRYWTVDRFMVESGMSARGFDRVCWNMNQTSADGSIGMTPTDAGAYCYSLFSGKCFSARAFSGLQVVMDSRTPSDARFTLQLASIADENCRLVTVQDTWTVSSSDLYRWYGSGSEVIWHLDLRKVNLDLCRLRSAGIQNLSSPSGGKTFYLKEIRLVSVCDDIPVTPPVTSAGKIPDPTDPVGDSDCGGNTKADLCGVCGGSNTCIGIKSVSPAVAAVNVSTEVFSITLDGWGLTRNGANPQCVLDGDRVLNTTNVKSSSVTCVGDTKQLQSVGGHNITLMVNSTLLPYGIPFAAYPSDAHITNCGVEMRYLSNRGPVLVNGLTLVDTGKVQCIFRSVGGRNTTAKPTMMPNPLYTNESSLVPPSWSCPLTGLVSDAYQLYLSLDGGKTTVHGRVPVFIADYPPLRQGPAKFWNSATAITINFDKAVRIGFTWVANPYNTWYPCNATFDPVVADNRKLYGSSCYVRDSRIDIELDPMSTILPGDVIQFRANSVFSRASGVDVNPLMAELLKVAPPDVPPKPKVVITAPAIVGQCDYLLISVAESYGGGGRPLNFTWWPTWKTSTMRRIARQAGTTTTTVEAAGGTTTTGTAAAEVTTTNAAAVATTTNNSAAAATTTNSEAAAATTIANAAGTASPSAATTTSAQANTATTTTHSAVPTTTSVVSSNLFANFTKPLAGINGTTKNYVGYGANDLSPGTNYTIIIVARNFLNQYSDPTELTFLKSPAPLPSVRILAAPSTQDATKALSVAVRAARAQCLQTANSNFKFLWEITPPVSGLPDANLAKPTLTIPEKLLTAGVTYTMKISVCTTDDPNSKAYDSFTVSVYAPDPQFTMTTKDFTSGVKSAISLKTYIYDAYRSGSSAAPNIVWSCAFGDGNPCTFSNNSFALSSFVNSTKVDIPANTLSPSTIYRFTAVYSPGYGRAAKSATVTVTTKAGTVPVPFAAVQLPSYQAQTVLTSDAVGIFGGLVDKTYDTSTVPTYQWSSVTDSGLATFLFDDIDTTNRRLNIPANTLMAGSAYRFMLTVFLGNQNFTATVDVSVALNPIVGNLGISIWEQPSKTSGFALTDTYDLTADDWTVTPDIYLPLMYSFEIFTSNTSTVPVISVPFQASGKLLVRMPEGRDGYVVVRVTARSTIGAKSSQTFNVKVDPFGGSTSDLKNMYDHARDEAAKLGDTGTLLQLSTACGKKSY